MTLLLILKTNVCHCLIRNCHITRVGTFFRIYAIFLMYTKDCSYVKEVQCLSIFKFKRVLNRVWISVLGVKMVFVMPAKKKNFYISLGYNCFSRWVLTKFGLKPRKKQGELSFPFDLVTTPINSLVQILENDFEDFCDDLYLEDTAEFGKMWKNRKYNICFPHDGGLSREELIQRYFARIDNFHKIVLNSENLCFVMTIFDRNYTNSALNSIYNSLQKLRQGREFDFCVVCLADKEAPPPPLL